MRVRPPGQSLDDVARLVIEKQQAGAFGDWALRSALEVDPAVLLPGVRAPAAVLAPHDGMQEASRDAARLLQRGTLVELPQHAYGLFDAAPAELAAFILSRL